MTEPAAAATTGLPTAATAQAPQPGPTGAHAELHARLARQMPAERLVTDALRRLTWGTDASFYRLVPQLIVVLESEAELRLLLREAAALCTPLTFRAAGTSLSGQAISDSVLVMLGDGWRGCRIGEGGWTVSLQPGVIGAAANRRLLPFQRKIGPDPASIDAAMVGGIVANNASGMCCGTAQNSYHTLAAMRLVLADGTVLDSADAQSRADFARARPDVVQGLAALAQAARADAALLARIRHKYRMKNTTGYSLNALVDFDDPIDILTHLMVGSEGTLGFISEVTYHTVPEHPHKASALILFDRLEAACRAVAALKALPVAAVELADRAALRSVQAQPGMPAALAELGDDAAALLVETRAESAAALAAAIHTLESALADHPTRAQPRFSTDAAECARYWAVRKGMFPSVGAVRAIGSTVVIEDVAFPVERLAEATVALQALLRHHGYAEAIIFGHALEGNLHFVFTQAFDTDAQVRRYAALMDDVATLVVERFDGALKAEHGTGRNMAPFVEREWGAQAYGLMRRIKALLDPTGLLNPGVVINDDHHAHLRHLKPLPAADARVDTCIECGFCEPQCPSRGLTLSPRQRIVGWREIARAERSGHEARHAEQLRARYQYDGLDTCATCGLCATACPVGIETGVLVKALRGRSHGPAARQVAGWAADQFGVVATLAHTGLAAADGLHGLLGSRRMQAFTDGLRDATGGRSPQWRPSLPRPVKVRPVPTAAARAKAPNDASAGAEPPTLVYFPSCAARHMGPARGDAQQTEPTPVLAQRLFERAGWRVVYPQALSDACCGQPFETKGFDAAAEALSLRLEARLREASGGGRWPIVFDTSPCTYRMRRMLQGRLPVQDAIEFIHDQVLPRLQVRPRPGTVALHPVCSVRKMGLEAKLAAVVARCAERVATVDDVRCCGFAGDRGFMQPELNAHALRHLKAALPADCEAGVSSSRTCEIGLAAFAGRPYRSFIHLVESATAATTPETA